MVQPCFERREHGRIEPRRPAVRATRTAERRFHSRTRTRIRASPPARRTSGTRRPSARNSRPSSARVSATRSYSVRTACSNRPRGTGSTITV
ncbi:hypothetical protein AB0R12_21130 [Streptomyces niveus]|uniref:hypothetical protein n=1 Tax=Streptomyces niveus TaxID=193462 RepID=UPI0034492EA5